MKRIQSLGRSLSIGEQRKLLGAGDETVPGDACSITCDAGKFACCTASLCVCITNGTTNTNCTAGGPGKSSCSA